MTLKLDIICLKGHDTFTNLIKQSDLCFLSNELGSKKVEINIITNISDLNFKNPFLIHDFSGCFNNYNLLRCFIDKYYIANKTYRIDIDKLNHKFKSNILTIDTWKNTVPIIFLNDYISTSEVKTTLQNLIKIKESKIPIKILEMAILSYKINKNNCKKIIKTYMKQKNVIKAFIRFGHGNNPSFLVDINNDSSFNINYKKYVGNSFSLSDLIIHPIRCDNTYMKGVISMIYIEGKYSHSIIKKPLNINVGIRQFKIIKYSPNFNLLYMSKTLINTFYNIGKYPFIQINYCYDSNKIYEYNLTKINYIDPKLYLETNKKNIKKIRKVIISRINNFINIKNERQKIN